MVDLQVGVIGASIDVTLTDQDGVAIDLSTSITRFIYLTRPNGKRTSKFSAALVSGGTTGRMRYTTVAATDLDVPGDWTIQAFYTNTAGSYSSARGNIVVLPNTF